MRRLKGFFIFLATLAGVVLLVIGLWTLQPLVALIGLVAPLLVTAAVSPISRRLALRSIVRRPRETLLVLVGTLLGTAIMTSSLVVGDSFSASIRQTAFTQLGPVDESISTDDQQQSDAIDSQLKAFPQGDIDGILSLRMARGATSVGGADPRVVDDALMFEVDFADAAKFGEDSAATGMSGSDPQGDNVVITDDVAKALNVGPNDSIDLYILGAKKTFKVERLLPRLGVAGYGGNNSDSGSSYNIFLPKGTLAGLEAAGNGRASFVHLISNRGDVTGGVSLTKSITDRLQQSLDATEATRNVYVVPEKQQLLDDAKTAGRVFSGLLTGTGSFTIIAGILLILNIFSMLAQERQSELGMLRAVGMRRRSLISAFSLEGALYALGSAVLGVLVGLAIARTMMGVAAGIFDTAGADIDLVYSVSLKSVAWSFLGGAGITMVAVLLASVFISRMNVIRAIRELPDTSLHRKRLMALVLGLLVFVGGGIATLIGLSTKNEFAAMVGPAIAGLGATLFLRRWVPTKLLLTIVSVAGLLWTLFAFTLAKKSFVHANPGVYVLQGVQLTAFAVAFISSNQDRIGGALRLFGRGKWTTSIRLGLAYPLARRGRTGLLLAMYALVIFVLTFTITISNVLLGNVDEQVAAQSLGTDITVEPTDAYYGSVNFEADQAPPKPVLPVEDLRKHPDIAQVALIEHAFLGVAMPARQRQDQVTVDVVDENFIGNGSSALSERNPAYASDADAYKAVINSTDLVIVNEGLLRESGETSGLRVGDKITLNSFGDAMTQYGMANTEGGADGDRKMVARFPEGETSGNTVELTVAGVAKQGASMVFGNKSAADELAAQDVGSADEVAVKVKDGVDAERLAAQLSGLYIGNNVHAVAIRAQIEDAFSVVRQFLTLIEGYLAIGLLVGIAGLGVVMVRAVRERRRQIGMLRAIGFPASSVRQAFLAESSIIAIEGIVIGAALALAVLNRVFSSLPADIGVELDVPWIQLGVLIVVTFVASLLATIWPARQASRIPPAVALRIVD